MTTNDMLNRIRVLIEEELGEFQLFSELPAAEIDLIADRLTRAIAPVVASESVDADQRAA
ncbi:hypothetical protein CNY89_21185 [Amaricoccus sp. HAR-UPW-R2A-40]|nr:hypothetical protein CNY89_21185 [Amaricoccus sp. HAR-UPW-R2A-40]